MTNTNPPHIGVIGGGQLARMMIAPATALNLQLSVLQETPDSPAQQAATHTGDHKNTQTVQNFAQTVDIITFDHEHVPAQTLETLETQGKIIRPSSKALAHTQNKLTLREHLHKLEIPQPKWARITNTNQLQEFMKTVNNNAIIKTPSGGYDGKGVKHITNSAEAANWLKQHGTLLAEETIPFTRELAQLAARRPNGETRLWPLAETKQKNGVCEEVIAPAPQNRHSTVTAQAAALAETLAAKLDITGVFAIELFETPAGQLLVNELAMRPHNSGHFTIEGSRTSQFEQHLRAVADLPLGDTSLTAPAIAMVNILGGPDTGMPSRYPAAFAAYPQVKIHCYGKKYREGRKVGHVTALGETAADVLRQARAAAKLFT